MSKHRLNYPDANYTPQSDYDTFVELWLTVILLIAAGLFGAALAFVVWGFK